MLLYQESHSENHSLKPKFSFPGSVMRQHCPNNPMKEAVQGALLQKMKPRPSQATWFTDMNTSGKTEVLISLLLFLYIHIAAYVKYPLQCRNQETFNKCLIRTDQEDGCLHSSKPTSWNPDRELLASRTETDMTSVSITQKTHNFDHLPLFPSESTAHHFWGIKQGRNKTREVEQTSMLHWVERAFQMYLSYRRLGMDAPLEGKMVNKEWSNNKFLSFLALALSLSSSGKGLKSVYSQASFNLLNEKFLEVAGWSTSAVFNWPFQRCCHILRYEVHSSK